MIYPWYTDTLQRQEAPRHHDRAENSFLQSGIMPTVGSELTQSLNLGYLD